MIDRSPDAERIEAHVQSLATSLANDPTRSWWPQYLFHTTELRNAVAILDSGQLLSRIGVGDDMQWENANREIIERTPADVQRMVRFYFRPRTPMSHNNEGFRTALNRHARAYCPIPVMLVFRSVPILTAVGTQFSDGNCSSHGTRRGSTASFFEGLPFEAIYHDSAWLSGDEGETIKRHRQAEVLVPSPFVFGSNAPHVRLRSSAERETLLSLLQAETVDRYRSRVQVSSKQRLFHKQWTYIESVSVLRDRLTIRFNESTTDTNEFTIRLTFLSPEGALITVSENRTKTIEPFFMTLEGENLVETPFQLRIELEGDLAYSGTLDPRPQQFWASSSRL